MREGGERGREGESQRDPEWWSSLGLGHVLGRGRGLCRVVEAVSMTSGMRDHSCHRSDYRSV